MMLPQVVVTSRTYAREMPVARARPSIVASLSASIPAPSQSAYSTKRTAVGFIVVVVLLLSVVVVLGVLVVLVVAVVVVAVVQMHEPHNAGQWFRTCFPTKLLRLHESGV